MYSVNEDQDDQDPGESDQEDEEEDGGLEESDLEDAEDRSPPAENAILNMPSFVFSSSAHHSPQLLRMAQQEVRLRVGQANDALRQLRVELGLKGLLYKGEVRSSKTTGARTRAFTDVSNVEKKVDELAALYTLARDSLICLKPEVSEETLDIYKELKSEHLAIPKDVTEPNRHTQRSDTLSWIWRVSGEQAAGKEAQTWMNECELQSPLQMYQILNIRMKSTE